jgi:transposase
MKNLNEALTKARRTIQQDSDETTKTMLKGCRWLLVKNSENLKAEEQEKLNQMLAASPELCACYTLKEDFRTIQSAPRSNGGWKTIAELGDESGSLTFQNVEEICWYFAQLVAADPQLFHRTVQ